MLRSLLMAAAGALILAAPAGAAPSKPEPESEEARGGRAITSATSYVALEPILAAVQADMSLRGVIHIELGLDAEKAATRRHVELEMARLRNAFNAAIAVYTGVYYTFGDVPDPDRIASLLQEATDRVLGPGEARILLGMVMVNGR